LIYDGRPRVIDDFQPDPSDPAIAHFVGQRSLMAIPLYDQGESLNMVVISVAGRAPFTKGG